MASISDIPVELLLDNLLPSLTVSSLLNLGCTSRFFALVCADDTFWKRKLQSDFNFSGDATARTSGWKFIYKGLRKPRLFVWGETQHGRLGLSRTPKFTIHGGVPFPVESRIPGVRLVNIIAGGMSFHALDADGHVFVWGTLDGTSLTLSSDGFSEPGKQSDRPLRLELPTFVRSVSCGRLHSMALDDNGHIWTFLNWGRPFRLLSPMLDCSFPVSTPLQIECGWAFSAVLTKSGDVLIFWPFTGEMHARVTAMNEEMDRDGDKKVTVDTQDFIPCVTWELQMNPTRLPALPRLPILAEADEGMETDSDIYLVQIAGLDNNIIGLTNKGHVLKFHNLEDETTVSNGGWEYLPNFSQVERVREHPTFSPQEGSIHEMVLDRPEKMQITHISAHFRRFIAYSTGSSSIVLMGSMETTAESEPTILPALQNRSVISVVLGDYHNGALTSTGKLLTWGNHSRGALGLGDPAKIEVGTPGGFATERQKEVAIETRRGVPPRVEVPTEVRFDHGLKKQREMFCFAATAAGWHMGALVIDLEPSATEDEEDGSEDLLTDPDPNISQLPPSRPTYVPGEMPSLARGHSVFRIGFAGRGMNRGSFGANIRGRGNGL